MLHAFTALKLHHLLTLLWSSRLAYMFSATMLLYRLKHRLRHHWGPMVLPLEVLAMQNRVLDQLGRSLA
jgi:hypothetical protein